MTKEKAIEILKYNSNVIHKTINGETDPNEVEALDMAIKALEQEPTTKENLAVDLIDRAELLKAMDTWDKFGNDPNEGLIPLRTPALQDRYVPYVKYDDMVNCVKGMSSVAPSINNSLECIDKCIDKDLVVDCISRINRYANKFKYWDEPKENDKE